MRFGLFPGLNLQVWNNKQRATQFFNFPEILIAKITKVTYSSSQRFRNFTIHRSYVQEISVVTGIITLLRLHSNDDFIRLFAGDCYSIFSKQAGFYFYTRDYEQIGILNSSLTSLAICCSANIRYEGNVYLYLCFPNEYCIPLTFTI